MKLMIRAHDLGVKGENQVVSAVHSNGLDGIQLVAYKCTDDVKYEAGAITPDRAKEIGDLACIVARSRARDTRKAGDGRTVVATCHGLNTVFKQGTGRVQPDVVGIGSPQRGRAQHDAVRIGQQKHGLGAAAVNAQIILNGFVHHNILNCTP